MGPERAAAEPFAGREKHFPWQFVNVAKRTICGARVRSIDTSNNPFWQA